MKYKALILLGLLITIIFLNSCTNTKNNKQLAINKCIELCRKAKQGGVDLTNGPCLSDVMNYNVNDYVCDIAHNPRQSIDNDPDNQCIAYRNGLRHHFVELDPNCSFIRAY